MGLEEQQARELATLRSIRQNGALSIVVGAGATIAAGGPSWPALVEWLLLVAINKGREIFYNMLRPEQAIRLSAGKETEVRQIRSQIEAGSNDTELLKRGAQLCADLFEETLFQLISVKLYPGARREPSRIHRSIANLAAHRTGVRPGLLSVINYNFDSLVNEALTEERVPYHCQFMANRKIEQFEPADNPPLLPTLPVIHLHGFTPRRPFFNIGEIDFVFSTRQFDEIYGHDQETIIDYAVKNYIRHPAHVALYVGCSFTDEAMNSVLRSAAEHFPSRPHYALLQQPKTFGEPDLAMLERDLQRYTEMGVQPVWYKEHDDIPNLLDRLA